MVLDTEMNRHYVEGAVVEPIKHNSEKKGSEKECLLPSWPEEEVGWVEEGGGAIFSVPYQFLCYIHILTFRQQFKI